MPHNGGNQRLALAGVSFCYMNRYSSVAKSTKASRSAAAKLFYDVVLILTVVGNSQYFSIFELKD